MNTTIVLLCVLGALVGCTDAHWASMEALGSPAHVICYSGGQVIYDGKSTGKVSPEEKSDGWLFKDAKTGRLVRLSGDCVIEN